MLLNQAKTASLLCILSLCLLCSCSFRPPYNNFHPYTGIPQKTATGASIGAAAGFLASQTLVGTLAGGAIGGAVGGAIGLHQNSKPYIIKQLQRQDIQYIEYGDTATLIVPTDKYYYFNSPRFNEICYHGLNNIVKLLAFYPGVPIYVVGFTDNVGTVCHKTRLSKAQAETMMTFLWANGIKSYRLSTIGYGDKHDIGDNHWIRGSAYNRRIEIQWVMGKKAHPYTGVTYLTK